MKATTEKIYNLFVQALETGRKESIWRAFPKISIYINRAVEISFLSVRQQVWQMWTMCQTYQTFAGPTYFLQLQLNYTYTGFRVDAHRFSGNYDFCFVFLAIIFFDSAAF
jgi:hypothetical protein